MSRVPSKQDALLRSLHPHTYAHAVQLLAEVPGLRVSSGRRTPERNREVGGSRRSFHLSGRAVDFTGTPMALRTGARLAWRLRVGQRCTGPEEVLLEDMGYPNQHLHVAW